MNATRYRGELEEASRLLAPVADTASIIGEGSGQFLSVSRGHRGVEVYRGGETEVVIDRALDNELLGEECFPSFEAAVAAAMAWLVDA